MSRWIYTHLSGLAGTPFPEGTELHLIALGLDHGRPSQSVSNPSFRLFDRHNPQQDKALRFHVATCPWSALVNCAFKHRKLCFICPSKPNELFTSSGLDGRLLSSALAPASWPADICLLPEPQ